jgi:hypothetical protein
VNEGGDGDVVAAAAVAVNKGGDVVVAAAAMNKGVMVLLLPLLP